MKSESFSIKAGFVLLCILWGSTWLAIKIGLDSIPPFYGLFFRFLLATIVLFAIMRIRRMTIPKDRESWKLFGTVGLLSLGLPFSIIYWAEQFLPSGLMSILFAVFPFMVAIFSHLFLPEEPLNRYKIIGIVLGFSGIFIIFSPSFFTDAASNHFDLPGMAGVIVATIFQAASVIIVKKKGKNVSPITLNFGGMLVGTFPVFAMALMVEQFSDIRFDAKAIGSVLYLSTFGSVVTFIVYYWLLKRLEAVYLSFLTFITPIVAVILGSIVLSEVLEQNTFLGATLVLVGILIANGKGLFNLVLNSQRTRV
jgi:drug/metabolite transporter (DMT)-like permease